LSALLEVNGVSKRFGGLQAVKELSLGVAPGEVLGVIGPNGAGKTTAINLISGVHRPDAGRVVFEGQDVTGLPIHALAHRGLVRTFQATVVYRNRTVRENTLRGAFLTLYPGFWQTFFNLGRAASMRSDTERRVDELLDWLGLRHVADVTAGSLPYGYQKTLGLCLALASSPRLIMLDEPAAGLSAEETDHVRDVIKRVNRSGVSVIVVDHNMRFMLGLCDRIVVMHHGEEIAQGPPEEVIQDPGVVAAYLGEDYDSAEPEQSAG
jgi:branched-chain amino acid transport system ATP-binding protein